MCSGKEENYKDRQSTHRESTFPVERVKAEDGRGAVTWDWNADEEASQRSQQRSKIMTRRSSSWFSSLHSETPRPYERLDMSITREDGVPLACFAQTQDGVTMLMIVAQMGKLQVVKYLIKKAGLDANAQDDAGNTALFLAAACGHLDVVEYLAREAGADTDHRRLDGNSALHIAAESGCTAIVKCLVIDYDAEVEAVDDSGVTPAWLAAGCGYLDILKFLVEECGSTVDTIASDGNTPATIAFEQGHKAVIDYFIEVRGTVISRPKRGYTHGTLNDVIEETDDIKQTDWS